MGVSALLGFKELPMASRHAEEKEEAE